MIFEFRTKTANRERKLMGFWNKSLKTVPAKVPLSNSAQNTPSTSAQTAPSTSAQSTNLTTENPSDDEKKNPVLSETSSKGMQLQCFMSSITVTTKY